MAILYEHEELTKWTQQQLISEIIGLKGVVGQLESALSLAESDTEYWRDMYTNKCEEDSW